MAFAPQPETRNLQFGIELELLLRPRPAFLEFVEKSKQDVEWDPDHEARKWASWDPDLLPSHPDEEIKRNQRRRLFRAIEALLRREGFKADETASLGAYDAWFLTAENLNEDKQGYCK